MNGTNARLPETWRIADPDPVAVPRVIEGALAAGPRRLSDEGRDRTAWLVLIIGLFGLAWSVLMRDVRVGMPARVTSTPHRMARGPEVPDASRPGANLTLPTAGQDGT